MEGAKHAELLEQDIAALSRWSRASNQQCAKGFDLFSDEIAERPHPRCSPHVAVKDEVEVQGNHRDRAKQPNKVLLVFDGGDRETYKPGTGPHRQYQSRRGCAYGCHARIGSGAISTGARLVCSDFEHRAVVVEKLREEIARLYHMGDSPEVATSQKP